MSALIEFEQVCKYYQMGDTLVKAADHITMKIEKGEFVAIVGSSGSGKTTLMNMIGCMDTPSKGSVKLEGRKLEDLNATQLADVRKNLIGLVFQKFYLVPHLTAVENVMVAQYYHSVVDEKQAMEALEKVEIAAKADNRPAQLSGGQQQRVAIARAVASSPKLLLLDEPTSGLDPVVRDEVLDLLYDFMQDENHAILLSSHITSDLDKIADEITFIHKGEVLLSEPRDDLLDTCGILRCTADQLDALDPSAVRAKRVGTFGCEALVRRDGVPENWSVEPVNIEQIMLFLTRGEDAR